MTKLTINTKEFKSLKDYMFDAHCYNIKTKEFDLNGLAKIGLCPYSNTVTGHKDEYHNALWNKHVVNDNNCSYYDGFIIIVFDVDRFKRNMSGAYEADYWEGIDSIRAKIK
tara:strand:- start:1529 stop:1861 length:333 start_codon:yes stop_codon:yes gene_type:complete